MHIYVHTNHENPCKRSRNKYTRYSFKLYIFCAPMKKKMRRLSIREVDFVQIFYRPSHVNGMESCLLQDAPVLKNNQVNKRRTSRKYKNSCAALAYMNFLTISIHNYELSQKSCMLYSHNSAKTGTKILC